MEQRVQQRALACGCAQPRSAAREAGVQRDEHRVRRARSPTAPLGARTERRDTRMRVCSRQLQEALARGRLELEAVAERRLRHDALGDLHRRAGARGRAGGRTRVARRAPARQHAPSACRLPRPSARAAARALTAPALRRQPSHRPPPAPTQKSSGRSRLRHISRAVRGSACARRPGGVATPSADEEPAVPSIGGESGGRSAGAVQARARARR